MENQNELLRMISQALQQNQLINNEILRLLGATTIPRPMLDELQRLISMNNSTLSLIKDATPIG